VLATAADAGGEQMPDLSGATSWLNSPPLNREQLKGKVVLLDFWTYSCINCLRSLPYMRAWDAKYRASGLVIIGVHTPEFEFETNPANIEKALRKFGITYPVAVDSKRLIWSAFNNQYWPAHYFIDAKGRVRYHHFGEGDYEESERWIQKLLKERNGAQEYSAGPLPPTASGAEVAADNEALGSPETYIGYQRAERFASFGGLQADRAQIYHAPASLERNQWGLSGAWIDHGEAAELRAAHGNILFRFHARDLHLVMGPGAGPVRFHVLIDGRPPGADHGVDCDEQGFGTVTEDRLYQLVRQHGKIEDRTFEIEFLDSGVRTFAFTSAKSALTRSFFIAGAARFGPAAKRAAARATAWRSECAPGWRCPRALSVGRISLCPRSAWTGSAG
jgi:thiol-disulfide isomerase/thioredoxin